MYISSQTYLAFCVVVDEVTSSQDKPPPFIVDWSEFLFILWPFHH